MCRAAREHGSTSAGFYRGYILQTESRLARSIAGRHRHRRIAQPSSYWNPMPVELDGRKRRPTAAFYSSWMALSLHWRMQRSRLSGSCEPRAITTNQRIEQRVCLSLTSGHVARPPRSCCRLLLRPALLGLKVWVLEANQHRGRPLRRIGRQSQ